MSTNFVRLTYEPEDEFHGELHAHAEVAGFVGSSSAYFNRATIQEFADQIRNGTTQLPMTVELALADSAGNVSIVISAWGNLGKLSVGIELNSQFQPDDLPQHSVLRFVVDYSSLDSFATSLFSILLDQNAEAVLVGD